MVILWKSRNICHMKVLWTYKKYRSQFKETTEASENRKSHAMQTSFEFLHSRRSYHLWIWVIVLYDVGTQSHQIISKYYIRILEMICPFCLISYPYVCRRLFITNEKAYLYMLEAQRLSPLIKSSARNALKLSS